MRRQWLAVVGTVGALVLVAACTTSEPEPARTDTVVVSVGVPFTSLNGATVQGR